MARNKRSLIADASQGQLPRKKLRLSDATEDESDLQSPNSLDSVDSENTLLDGVVTEPEDQDIVVTDSDKDSVDDQEDGQTTPEDHRNLSDEAAMERLQRMRARRNNAQNHAAENAIIEEVSCTNFMCHAALSIKLGPLINFIIGHNGSGKSAVLTALTICLGGKASATNRGGSLKSFIKEGKDKATLKVRIKNQGRSAYKPDEFGSSIIVERHFSRSGASGYNLRNAQGKVLSSSRRDVDDMLDYFALALDNPMNVLTQDQARAFLNSSSAKDKYKFFNKGTQLETLDHDYQAMEESLTTIENYMGAISDQKVDLRSKYEVAKRDTQRVAGQRKILDEINRIRMQMCWVQVEESERTLEECETDLRKVDDEIQERQEQIDEADVHLAEAKGQHEAAQSIHKNLKEEELDPLLGKKSELSAEFKDNASELQQMLSEKRSIKAHIDSATKTIGNLKDKIREEKEKLENTDSRTAQIHLDLQNEKEKHTEAQQAAQELKGQLEQESEELERLKVEASSSKDEYDQQSQKVRSCKERIQQIKQQGGGVVLSSQVKKLLDAINRSRNFRVKPLGPLAEYVYLKEPKWSSILERSFGGALNAFVVTSKEDANELTKLMKQYQVNAAVLIGNPRPIDTSRQEPPEKFLTWLRVLRINNDLIRNQFIINQSVEKSVLIEDREEAHEVLMNQQASNIRQIFCFTDDQTGKNRGAGIRLHKSKAGSSTNPIQPWVGAQRMRSDIQAQISFENDVLSAEEASLVRVKFTYQAAQRKLEEQGTLLNKTRRDLKKQRELIDKLEESVSRLQDKLEEATPQTGVLEEYEKKLHEATEEKRMHSDSYQLAVTAIDEKNAEQRDLKVEMDVLDSNISIIKKKVSQAETEANKLDTAKQDRLYAKNGAIASLRDAENLKEVKENERDKVKEDLVEVTRKAAEYFERVPVDAGETYHTLQLKFEKLQKDLQEAQRQMGGSEEDLKRRELEAKIAYEDKCVSFEKHRELAQNLKMSLNNRRIRWNKFREHISIRATNSFSYLLSERQFRGSLIIKHSDKELDIHVEPDITRKSDKGRATKTLSGGEKSFSTICMLLALWEAMGSPIRCLDEFDVFMDNVNRDVSVKMLIQAARRAVSRQFVLITPQSMANVSLDTDVKIHKMRDPERGQTALPYGSTQATQS